MAALAAGVVGRTLVAGVDSSTQSCKVVVVDAATGEVLRTGRASHPDGTSVNPQAWWDAFGAAVTAAGGLDDIVAISVGGQQHGLVALDNNGRVIRDALLWNDTRSADAARELVAEIGAVSYSTETGVVPVASFTATKLRWLRDSEPENAARVAAVALPHDWLSWRLRGYGPVGESPLGPDLDELATDRSDASGTAYFNSATGEYSAALFERAFGRPLRVAGGEPVEGAVIVPAIVAAADTMGILGVDVQLPGSAVARRGLAVGAGAGDNAAAALGLGIVPGDVVISIGTSGTVFGVTDTNVIDATGAVAGFADATGFRLPIITTLNAAKVLDLVADLLDVDHAGLSELILAADEGSGGVTLVPYFAGERTPDLPTATASFSGLTLTNATRANFARAAAEGMLCGLSDGLDALSRVSGGVPKRVLLIGGAARNPAIQAVAGSVFDAAIEIPPANEYVAIGAAVQAAWIVTGERPQWRQAGTVVLEARVNPEIRSRYAVAAAAVAAAATREG
jgi:xylulokinase